jgi:glutamate synthase domain-containing protein 2
MTRFTVWQIMIALTVYCSYLLLQNPDSTKTWAALLFFLALSSLGFADWLQKKHAILHNYPVIGHLRFLLEFIRPEIRQYFLESDTEKLPFSRNQRGLVYQRSKNLSDHRPFGTLENIYENGYEWLNFSNAVAKSSGAKSGLHVLIGETQCAQPYAISLLNISAMSFGSLSANAILALNKGAKLGGFAQDTGEGSVSKHHRVYGGDLIWEIGSGYFGCRDDNGFFDIEKFSAVANDPQIKMIEIKLSQGAKPGHGGILPAAKITPEIAETRGIEMGVDCVSPSRHSAFDSPKEMLKFIELLRQRSNGKPIGFKLCVGRPEDWFEIVQAMIESKLKPDFIVVDGSEGGTGSAPVEYIDHVGMPMRDGLRLIHSTLVGVNLRSDIKIGAAGKIISAFDMVRVISLGADWCNSARGFMFALGCIQSRTCNTDFCPTGVATQDSSRQKALNPLDKGDRVHHFHKNTLHAFSELLTAAGIKNSTDLSPALIMKRDENGIAKPLSHNLLHIEAGALLSDNTSNAFADNYAYLGDAWERVKSDG